MYSSKTCLVLFAAGGWLLAASVSGCARPVAAGPAPDPKAVAEIRKQLAEGAPEAAGEAAAAEPTGTGWATLRGSFKFDGTPPARKPLSVDKDTEICGKGQGILNNSLMIGPDKGISNIVIYARAKRVHDSAKPLPAENQSAPLLFDQKECMFLTHVMACQVHQKVDIKNSDPISHNTKIDPAKGLAMNQNLPAKESAQYTPTDETAFPAGVSCSIHPWMRAYLLPRNDKYFAVTKSDGSFEIPNLPAGEELELQAWHERAAGANGALVLVNQDLKWTNKGRFKVKLEPDETKELTLTVPDGAFK